MKKFRRLSFSEYIKELPSSIVFRNLLKEKKKERRIISSELIDIIKKEIASKDSLISRFDMMSLEAKKICALTYLFGYGGLKAVEYEEYHEELLNSFLIYSAHDKYGTNYYFGFNDIEKILSDTLSSFLTESGKTEVEAKPVPFLTMRCLNDFTVMLVLALKGILKKKRDGGLAQISVSELRKGLHATVESCSFGKKVNDFDTIINLLLAYGIDRDFLTEEDKFYSTTDEQANKWLLRSYQDSYKDFNNFVVDYCGAWSMVLFNKMLDTIGNSWFATSFFPVSCREKAITILQILHYMGIIEAGSEGNDIFWRRNVTVIDFFKDTSKQKVVILADFSAVLPQEVLPETLFTFSLLGAISKLDRVYKGIIDQNTVNESLSRRVKGDVLLSHLGKWGAPENVITTVKEWIREYLRLCIIKGDMIITFDEKTSMQISSYGPLRDIIEPLNADSVFSVKKGREKDALELLITMGFDPRVPEVQLPKPIPAHRILAEDFDEELTLSLDFEVESKKESRPVPSGKYSEELKELGVNELFHVIDYAILMGHSLRLEYEGSPYLKRGIYTIAPLKLENGVEPYIEGKTETSGAHKKYYIKRIKRIGVKSQ